MPDRRQADRRESSSLQSKKLTVSVGTFISVILIAVIVVVSVIACRITYLNGYDTGYWDCYLELNSENIEEDYSSEESTELIDVEE